MVTEERRGQIAAGLAAAHLRIANAEVDAGREPGSVDLIVVTKTHGADEVEVLADLGVVHVGENRDQEASPKAELLVGRPLVWHFIGQLQTNKVRSVVAYADVVESVDRSKLVGALSRAAVSLRPADRPVRCLVQVCLDDQPGRGGALPDDVLALAEQISAAPGLELGGVMAVAPLEAEADDAFARLNEIAVEVSAAHPRATTVSAGMSGDLESAIRHGATQVRLGSVVLGSRPPVG
ncbi:MAG: YggS family pyridoxal phosphate-dependent enzyme [Actinomycetes bacterium]